MLAVWCGYMVELEKQHASEEEISKLYNRATVCTKKHPDVLVQVRP